MKKTVAFLLVFCLFFVSFLPQSVAASDVVRKIRPETECSLTVRYAYGDAAFSHVPVKLYRVASVSAEVEYILTPSFAGYGLSLNDIRTAKEWKAIRSTLEAHVLARGIEPDAVAVTDGDGRAVFAALETGMYLAVVGRVVQGELECCFDAALIPLPGPGADGDWQYHAVVNAKGEVLPPINPDGAIERKVLKLWKGDEGLAMRPASVTVEIYRDGVFWESVTLSEETQWAYRWMAEDDGSVWTVVESDVPDGYVMTVEERENTFVLVNTVPSDNPETPGRPPQTGDTANIPLYILLMIVSGTVLIVLGVVGRRKSQ